MGKKLFSVAAEIDFHFVVLSRCLSINIPCGTRARSRLVRYIKMIYGAYYHCVTSYEFCNCIRKIALLVMGYNLLFLSNAGELYTTVVTSKTDKIFNKSLFIALWNGVGGNCCCFRLLRYRRMWVYVCAREYGNGTIIMNNEFRRMSMITRTWNFWNSRSAYLYFVRVPLLISILVPHASIIILILLATEIGWLISQIWAKDKKLAWHAWVKSKAPLSFVDYARAEEKSLVWWENEEKSWRSLD